MERGVLRGWSATREASSPTPLLALGDSVSVVARQGHFLGVFCSDSDGGLFVGDDTTTFVKKKATTNVRMVKHHQEVVNAGMCQKDLGPNLILVFSCPGSNHVNTGLLPFGQNG